MDAVARHQLAARDAVEVVEPDIGLVAVPEGDRVTGRKWTVGLLPHDQMHRSPARLQREIVVDLSFEIAVLAQSLCADRLIELDGHALAHTFFELRLPHAPR